MLKGIDPRLNAELLHVLRAMGHGDVVVLADANFPADALARETAHGALLRLDAPLPDAARAILSVLPLDTFVDDHAMRMEVVGAPDEVPEVQREVAAAIVAAGDDRPMTGVERFAFYGLARGAYAVVQTAERRFYGCVAFRKGVIGPDEPLPGDGA
jgi:L-fucose mutarotase